MSQTIPYDYYKSFQKMKKVKLDNSCDSVAIV